MYDKIHICRFSSSVNLLNPLPLCANKYSTNNIIVVFMALSNFSPRGGLVILIPVQFHLELLILGKFISREGNKFPGTRSGLDRVSILSAANR